jgi:hypothetical protein
MKTNDKKQPKKPGPKRRVENSVLMPIWISEDAERYFREKFREAQNGTKRRLTIGQYFEEEYIELHKKYSDLHKRSREGQNNESKGE